MNILEVYCAFCPWRESYTWMSDSDPEKSARGILREHIATAHDALTLRAFDEHIAKHGLTDIGNWSKATRNDLL